MGKVTWLPVQELIKGWTDSSLRKLNINDRIDNTQKRDRYRGNNQLGPYRWSRENSQGRRMEIRPGFNPRGKENLNCYNCGKQGHMVRDCQETKCFECGKFGHIAPYCPGKRDKLRCAGCGRFGHNREDCNVANFNTRGGFPQRDMAQIAPNVRILESEKNKDIEISNLNENKSLNNICFRCRKEGHVARECQYL
ncbi:unnamed protein product [Gordionus sp. m RMFG-2023]